MAARKSLGGAGLPPLADLFSTSEERALEAQTQERVMMLPVSELHDFPGHPFRYHAGHDVHNTHLKISSVHADL